MKKPLFIQMVWVIAGLMVFASCKETGKGKSMLPPVSGSTNEVLVVMPKALWQGSVGDTIKHFFQQPQVALPQPEPIFDVINLPASSFDKNVKSHRNVLLVSITNKVDSASIEFYESTWARSQKIFKISAPDVEAFYRIFDANKEKIMGVFLKAERDRLIGVYKKSSDERIFNTFRDKYNMLLYCPGGYVINKDTANFVWISSETQVDSKGIIFFEEPYTEQGQLNYQVIIGRVDEMLKKYIPGPLKNTWMALDSQTPMSMATYHYKGVYYAVMIKGLWTVVNDFMGGPFILNVVLDEKNNRIIYMMGYVYAPEGKKRNMMRQVESILYSMEPDLPEAGQ